MPTSRRSARRPSSALSPCSFCTGNQQPDRDASVHEPPTQAQLQKFIERCHAKELAIELPMELQEAADYVGLVAAEVEQMAIAGSIPAHSISDALFTTWTFYASELDCWLCTVIGGGKCQIR